jgi:DNA polymerase-1
MIDFLALTGDSVDNVPGIPKCGPKTAAKWLNAYGSLDGVVESAESIGGKIGETLREHMHVLPLSKALVTIKTDCELPVGLEQLARSAPDLEQLTALYSDLELNQFLRRIQQSPAVNETSLATPEAIETSYELVTTPERLTFWMDQCRQAKIFALDTETTSLMARHAKLVGVSLSCMAGQACYIPVGHVEANN